MEGGGMWLDYLLVIIVNRLTLIIMKRTKSTLSLRNLAMSIKHSIQLEADRTAKKEFVPLKTAKSFAHLQPKERNTQSCRQEATLNREQKENRIFVLEKQIANLQKQLKASENLSKDYSRQLNEYDQIAKRLASGEQQLLGERQAVEQLKNQILMLQEEIHSTQFNIEERVAEKEYHEQLVEAYQNQYEGESKLTMSIIALEERNQEARVEVESIDKRVGQSKIQLQEWKKEIDFELNEHKLKNNIKMVRMKLIGYEDQCDAFCADNNLRKIRELYCLYFKNYAKTNGVGNEEIEDGIDIFICKSGLSEDFGEFVRERLVYNKPKCPLLEEYIQTLQKMESIYKKSIFQVNKKVHFAFKEDLKALEQSKEQKLKEIQENLAKIKQISEQTDELFNNQSIAVIEYMREKNKNKYDLKEIKTKLRENKKEQRVRISKVRQSYHKAKELEMVIEKSNFQLVVDKNKDEIEDLTQSLIHSELHLQELQRKQSKQKREKDLLEDRISNQITRWRQIDEKKVKLTALYQQLQAANRHEVNDEKYEFRRTKNHIYSSKKSTLDNKYLIKNELDDIFLVKNHSKNTSILSMNQSKSILSLSNPFKKMIEKSKESYEPILSNCQMILSRKLTQKDLDYKDLESRNSKVLHEKNSNELRDQQKSKVKMRQSKENIWTTRNKSETMTPYKLSVAPTTSNPKGKVCMSQRESLSKLLISKFGR